MKKFNLTSAIIAGLLATAAMTMLLIIAPMMGMPKMDIGGMLAMFMGVPVTVGWIAHFMIGTALAIGYALFFVRATSLSGTKGGLLYSVIPWLMAQIIVMPMMGTPLFSGSMVLAGASLMGHLLYGTVLGSVYRCQHEGRSIECARPIRVAKHSPITS
ncbi:hypothetical protein HZB60_12465 [candidate division KSB1 bacterium]|nr:hypothetical protein [candidate division KSB1 bacterium]